MMAMRERVRQDKYSLLTYSKGNEYEKPQSSLPKRYVAILGILLVSISCIAIWMSSSPINQVENSLGKEFHGAIGFDNNGIALWEPTPIDHPLNAEETREAHRGYCFNTKVSESLSLNREIPYAASEYCMNNLQEFNALYPPNTVNGDIQSSVIIVFHNENLSVLLRSIHSVLNKTPQHLLGEIILIDDQSNPETHPWLQTQLEEYIRKGLVKTRLKRLEKRGGLMGARAAGAKLAKYPILVFLDSHIEVLDFWLQPLILHIQKDWKSLALPKVCSIEANTFEVTLFGIDTLGFTWSMGHKHMSEVFDQRPENINKGEDEPKASPLMPGGIFAMHKKWWNTLGGYDEEMEIYGGEEFELSFKTWMCGGSMHVVPCSKVAHVFRTGQYWQGQVYPVSGETITRNKLRVAHVWMDEYVKYVKLAMAPLTGNYSLGDLTHQKKIKHDLGCKSFDWYIQNVYPELKIPNLEHTRVGYIKNKKTSACLDNLGSKEGHVGIYPCHYQNGTQAFALDSENGLILVAQYDYEICAIGDSNALEIQQVPCNFARASGDTWKLEDKLLKYTLKSGKSYCLKALEISSSQSPLSLVLAACDANDRNQHFTMD